MSLNFVPDTLPTTFCQFYFVSLPLSRFLPSLFLSYLSHSLFPLLSPRLILPLFISYTLIISSFQLYLLSLPVSHFLPSLFLSYLANSLFFLTFFLFDFAIIYSLHAPYNFLSVLSTVSAPITFSTISRPVLAHSLYFLTVSLFDFVLIQYIFSTRSHLLSNLSFFHFSLSFLSSLPFAHLFHPPHLPFICTRLPSFITVLSLLPASFPYFTLFVFFHLSSGTTSPLFFLRIPSLSLVSSALSLISSSLSRPLSYFHLILSS